MDQDLLDFAVDLACRAGNLAAARFFAGDPRTSRKPDGTEVTAADLAVEEVVRGELARHAPDDEVYGEEGGTTAGTSGRRWVVDPIDGTYYFARRIPLFNTRLAFEDEHGPAIGVIREPIARQTVFAGRGRGCWRSTDAEAVPVRVSDRTGIGGARTAMGNPGTWPEELLLALHRRVFLSTSGGTTGLATGQVDAYVIAGFPMGYEDVAPLPVIVGEAGGRVTDLSGNPVLSGDGTVLATNGHLHDAFLALVHGLPTARDWRALGDDPTS
ncbi:inositol monophosphatase family protein [Actinophytocola oryzae]|uniref:inositol monophosphatase family protein n=1 Tax=Actinophytocola oryzae TaxID=502181 RepID=UPI001AAE3272|nr:inositol monophosphatase family protein [Actinophytocola oryzae]